MTTRGSRRCWRRSPFCPTRTAAPTCSTDLIREAGVRLTRRANIDLGLGALAFIAELPPDVPLFAIARLAGFAAHLAEELTERPLRYRGLARNPT